MKKYVMVLLLTIIQFALFSQDLLSKYKTGRVNLVADKSYARGNDWNTIFRSYNDVMYGKPMGSRKSLVLLDDGSVIVNHAYRDYHTKFSPTGKFIKEFEIEQAGHKAVMGVINGNTLFTELDNMGKMTCSDLDGGFKKTLTLDYITDDIIALDNEKFAVVGWVLWAEKIRSFVSIVDYGTNEEKVIWEHFTDRVVSSKGDILNNRKQFNYTAKLNSGATMLCSTMPYSKNTGKGLPPVLTTVNNTLLVAIPNTGEILEYDLNGNLQSKSKITWSASTISVEEQKKIQQKAIDRYKNYIKNGGESVEENLSAYNQMVSEMEEDLRHINSPLSKPAFSNIIKDSDGNVLFFEIPEEKGSNVFHVWVYDQGGEFVTKCTFVSDDYDLNINSSKMVFYDGYIYGLQPLKGVTENPLRLVRFKLE